MSTFLVCLEEHLKFLQLPHNLLHTRGDNEIKLISHKVFFKVVLQKSTSPQIHQLTLHITDMNNMWTGLWGR